MIKITNGRLPRVARNKLDEYQEDVDSQPNYSSRVDRAKSQFSSKNKNTNATFRAVREKLTDMCNGARRCMYCEDSVADEVEHFQPKDLYPEYVFAWRNYLYACGPCNGPKNNKFSVVDAATNNLVDVTRARGAAVVPPQGGMVALINPLREDPLDFMMLDLRNTFEFTPLATAGTTEHSRTEYTIKILRLNERDYLIDARKSAYGGFKARLVEYVQAKNTGASSRELSRLKRGIQRCPHPTVWAEMKRQHSHHPSIANLFQQAPEAEDF